MYFSTMNNSVLARLFHREARKDARWKAAAKRMKFSQTGDFITPIKFAEL